MKMRFCLKFAVLTVLLLGTLSGVAQERFGGMTLYTVRNEMATDPEETLEQISEMGYRYIEAVEYRDGKFYNMAPEAFKRELDKLEMIPLSVHMGGASLDNADQLIADAKEAGFKYFVAPVPPMGLFKYDRKTRSMNMTEDLDSLVNILSVMGQKCHEAGLDFLYHNHDFEFKENKNGIVPIEYMLENLDSAYVNFQMDLYWVSKAGADPVAYFEQYPGRFKVWHVKDMDDKGRFAPVGKGTIDFARILEHKDLSGMQYYIVEQDRTFRGMKPLEAVRLSREGLKKFGFQ
jgi:sugar phosphate isomerase/epimerase